METPDSPWAKDDNIRIHKPKTLPPHQAAIFFYEFLKSKHVVFGRMIDIGGGNGQNTVYFAERGFEVHCVDTIHLQDLDLHGVTSHSYNVGEYWQFETDFFDVGFDILCYANLSDAEKKVYQDELKRVLNPGAYFLLLTPKSEELETFGLNLLSTKKVGDQNIAIMQL